MEVRFLEATDTSRLEEVSGLLRQCFRPPSVGYQPDKRRLSAEMLAWQLGYPSSLRPRLITLADSRVLGCLALWPRRMSFRRYVRDLLVLTLVAVSPEARRMGLGRRLYEAAQEEAGLTILAFAEAGGPGEALLLRSLSQRPGTLVSLGSYRGLMAVATSGDGPRPSGEWQEDEPTVVTICPDADFLAPAPSLGRGRMSALLDTLFLHVGSLPEMTRHSQPARALVSLPATDQGWATLELIVGRDWDLGPQLNALARRVGGKVGAAYRPRDPEQQVGGSQLVNSQDPGKLVRSSAAILR